MDPGFYTTRGDINSQRRHRAAHTTMDPRGVSVPELSNDVVLRVPEAAILAKVSPWLIRREIKAGNLHARRIGSCIRITRAEFDRWLGGDVVESS